MSGPKLSDEDRAILERMLANRDKARERRSQQGTAPTSESTLAKKWERDGFLRSSEDGDDRAWQLEQLQSPDARSRAYVLRMLASRPVADEELLLQTERLLDDRTITLLDVPDRVGEVRWAAANAVAALRGALARLDPVTLEDAWEPVTSAEVLARDAGIEHSHRLGWQGTTETLEQLLRMGALRRTRVTRHPGRRG